MADNRLAKKLRAHELADTDARFCSVICNHCQITPSLADDLVHHAFRRTDTHEAANHQAGAVGNHGNSLIEGYSLHFCPPRVLHVFGMVQNFLELRRECTARLFRTKQLMAGPSAYLPADADASTARKNHISFGRLFKARGAPERSVRERRLRREWICMGTKRNQARHGGPRPLPTAMPRLAVSWPRHSPARGAARRLINLSRVSNFISVRNGHL